MHSINALTARRDLTMDSPEDFLRRLFDTAVEAVLPEHCLPGQLPAPPDTGRTIVVGAGKGAAAMAQSVEAAWPGNLSGLVVTRYGHGAETEHIDVLEAAHPVPDAAGRKAAERMLQMVDGLDDDDLVLCLLSGGGSALLTAPAPGVPLDDKQTVNKALLRSGATIFEINCVRKHLSAIKGGRLARAAYPARVVTLMISDVPGDDPAVVASGPTLADATTLDDARAVLAKYGIEPPESIAACLTDPANETPKPGDDHLTRSDAIVVARAADALAAAEALAEREGFETIVLGDDLEGEARGLGAVHARLALDCKAAGRTVLIVSGGETTVTVRGNGRGGRNVEYLLGLAQALSGADGIYAIACDTDGIDGSEDNAGAVVLPDTLARARDRGIDPQGCLDNNDAYGLFSAIGDLVMTGPTRTNVNDFRAILVTNF